MSQEETTQDELQEANDLFQAGLQTCQELIADLRSKLAANVNEPLFDNDAEAEDGHDQSVG